MCLMDLATYASKEKKLQKKANEFYKLARDASRNMFMCPGPAEEPSTIEDDANTTDAKDESKGGYMSTIINYGGCAPKGSWVSRACTIGKSLRVL